MSFPRYSDYRDSGLNWLGYVPEHWKLKRLGYYLGERREKVSDRDYQPLSVTKDGIVPQLETAAKTDDGDNRKRVCKGDFVINSRSDRKGSSGLSNIDGSVSLISTVLKPKESVHGAFVHHLLRSIPF
jgi:type I restriction enzyme S subunit